MPITDSEKARRRTLRGTTTSLQKVTRSLKRAQIVLSVDSLGALVAGCTTILAAHILSAWYGWSGGFTLFVGLVNIGYGCYSGVLALHLRWKTRLSRWTIIVLIAANSIWAVQCFTQVGLLSGSASFFGLSHLLLEGLWVGGLAYLEARIALPVAA